MVAVLHLDGFFVGRNSRIHENWDDARAAAARKVREADAAMITSCCPDAGAAKGCDNNHVTCLQLFS